MSNLPPEIITSILIRLPVKSLLRFRCVSKPWCAQIDGPDFIKLHLTHSITTGSNQSFIAEFKNTLYSLDFDSLQSLKKIETPFINISEWPSLFNICNGLLLFETTDDFILFNPSTRKHLILPTPPDPEDFYDNVVVIRYSKCLGYDVINDDYKVFNIIIFGEKWSYKIITSEAWIYSLKSNEWHIVKDFIKGMLFDWDFDSYVSGALHTVNDKDCTSIFALDVCKEAIDLMPLPNIGDKSVSRFNTHVFDGCLAVLCWYSSDNRTDIWVMKDYGVKESWSMLFSVKQKNSFPYVMPMVYSKSRTEVLFSSYDDKFVWYDLRKKTARGFQVSGLPAEFGLMVCVENLVSVVGPWKSAEHKKQHAEEKLEEIAKKKSISKLKNSPFQVGRALKALFQMVVMSKITRRRSNSVRRK